MMPTVRRPTYTTDPLIVALAQREPLDAAVLKDAIDYREAMLEQLSNEVEVLKVRRARMLNESC